jgi:hypothetical protein
MEFHPIKWQAHEYFHYERTTDWYWAVAIITLSIIALSILFDDYLFSIVILIGVFSLLMYANRKPRLVSYELNRKGLRVDSTLYPYASIESFWVEDHHEHPEPRVIFKSAKVIMPYIVVPIEGVHPDDIHTYLLNFLPEEEHHEPLAQKIMEHLGF